MRRLRRRRSVLASVPTLIRGNFTLIRRSTHFVDLRLLASVPMAEKTSSC
jgi:hypothetical protein